MTLSHPTIQILLQLAIEAAQSAGRYIASKTDTVFELKNKKGKENHPPEAFTEVDLKSQEIILNVLTPTLKEYDLALLTEEIADDNLRFEKDYFWCIDPLDGTLPFIEGEIGYSVSIALVSKKGEALLGVIYDPFYKNTYHAVLGHGAFKNGNPWIITKKKISKLSVITDRSFYRLENLDKIVTSLAELATEEKLNGMCFLNNGGGAMSAMWVLENAPACYFKVPKKANGGGSVWDFAASACIVKEMKANVSDIHGDALDLNKKDSTYMNVKGVLYASETKIADKVKNMFKTFF